MVPDWLHEKGDRRKKDWQNYTGEARTRTNLSLSQRQLKKMKRAQERKSRRGSRNGGRNYAKVISSRKVPKTTGEVEGSTGPGYFFD